MAIYGISHYGLDTYGFPGVPPVEERPVRTPVGYDASPFRANPVHYDTLQLNWSLPPDSLGSWDYLVLCRDTKGPPVYPDSYDSDILIDTSDPNSLYYSPPSGADPTIPGSGNPSAPTSYTDTGLTSGRFYYYTIFVRKDDVATPQWRVAATVTGLVDRDYSYGRRMYDLLPDMYHTNDLEFASDDRENGQLLRYLGLLGTSTDHVRTEYETLRNVNRPSQIAAGLLPLLGNELGAPYETMLGARRTRAKLEAIVHLYRTKGTRPGIEGIAKAISGFAARVGISFNILYDKNVSRFHEEFVPSGYTEPPIINITTDSFPMGGSYVSNSDGAATWKGLLIVDARTALVNGTVTLPTGTITVVSTSGFAASGTLIAPTSTGIWSVNYTSKNSTQFLGCTGGSGSLTNGSSVTFANGRRVSSVVRRLNPHAANHITTIGAASNGASLPQATITVADTTGFPASGAIFVTTTSGPQLVIYTSKTGTTFTTDNISGAGTMATGGTVEFSDALLLAALNPPGTDDRFVTVLEMKIERLRIPPESETLHIGHCEDNDEEGHKYGIPVHPSTRICKNKIQEKTKFKSKTKDEEAEDEDDDHEVEIVRPKDLSAQIAALVAGTSSDESELDTEDDEVNTVVEGTGPISFEIDGDIVKHSMKIIIDSSDWPELVNLTDHTPRSIATTTIAAGSDGASLPQETIQVASITGFPLSGLLNVTTGTGTHAVYYTGATVTPSPRFTGCTSPSGTGAMSLGGTVRGVAFYNGWQRVIAGTTTTITFGSGLGIYGVDVEAIKPKHNSQIKIKFRKIKGQKKGKVCLDKKTKKGRPYVTTTTIIRGTPGQPDRTGRINLHFYGSNGRLVSLLNGPTTQLFDDTWVTLTYTAPVPLGVDDGTVLVTATSATTGQKAYTYLGVNSAVSITQPVPPTGPVIKVNPSRTDARLRGTTITSASHGASLPQTTINVVDTTGFAASGTIYVVTTSGVQTVPYTSKTGTTFTTNGTSGSGTMATGGAVVYSLIASPTPGNPTGRRGRSVVIAGAGFPVSSTVTVYIAKDLVGTATTDSAGNFSTSVPIPVAGYYAASSIEVFGIADTNAARDAERFYLHQPHFEIACHPNCDDIPPVIPPPIITGTPEARDIVDREVIQTLWSGEITRVTPYAMARDLQIQLMAHRINLVKNPSFEAVSGVTSWNAVGSTQITTRAYTEATGAFPPLPVSTTIIPVRSDQAAELSVASTGDDIDIWTLVDVVGGVTYVWSVYSRAEVTARRASLNVEWIDNYGLTVGFTTWGSVETMQPPRFTTAWSPARATLWSDLMAPNPATSAVLTWEDIMGTVSIESSEVMTTAIAAGSDGDVLPQAVIAVDSAAGFEAPGTLAITVIVDIGTGQTDTLLIPYTGISGDTFTGCSGGDGNTLREGDVVTGRFSGLRNTPPVSNTDLWPRPYLIATAPQNASRARIHFTVANPAVAEKHYVDAALFERGDSPKAYFDASAGGDYIWETDSTGQQPNPHNSPSHWYPQFALRDLRLKQVLPDFIPAGATFVLEYGNSTDLPSPPLAPAPTTTPALADVN